MKRKQRVSVSLKYPQNVDAPLIPAKAEGILVVEDDVLANVLTLRQIGECIPETTWQAVAGVFAMISALEKEGSS